jgi:hypothetical protein
MKIKLLSPLVISMFAIILFSLTSCQKDSNDLLMMEDDSSLIGLKNSQQERPFSGSMTYYHDLESEYTCDCSEGYAPGGPWVGTGNFTHLGNSEGWSVPCFVFGWSTELGYHFENDSQCGEFIAANGDILNLDIPSYIIVYDVECGCFSGSVTGTFDGGTGRFEDATGEVTAEVVAYLPVFDPSIVSTTTTTKDGVINY